MDRFDEVWEDLRVQPRQRLIASHRRPPSEWAGNVKRVFVVVVLVALTASSATTVVPPRKSVQSPEALTPSLVYPPAPEIRVEPQRPSLAAVANSVEFAARLRRPAAVRPLEVKPNKVEIVIAFAMAQQGDPYRWANSGPNAYDCSGLVLRAFAQIGIKLPHYTGTMVNYGKRVSRSELRRGDMVFPTSGHVGIYLDGDVFIHASSSRGRVVIGKLYSFYTARRLT